MRRFWPLLICWVVLGSQTVAAGQRKIIAPGIEKVIHANGSVEYRQIAVAMPVALPEPAVEVSKPEPVAVKLAETLPVAAPKIYKYRDKNGVVTYQSAVPPSGISFVEFKPRTRNSASCSPA